MGLSLVDLQTILRLRREGLLPGRFAIADLGAQQFSNDALRAPEVMSDYATAFDVAPRGFGVAPPKSCLPGVEHQAQSAPYAKPFWDWLGCPYLAIDYDGAAHCLPLDLNFDEVPIEHRGRYDLVTNFGTTEHVANQLQAMKVIHDLVKHNGLMLHTVPAQGNADHAMFNYNPKFFFALSRACGYHIYLMRLLEVDGGVPLKPDLVEFIGRSAPQDVPALQAVRLVDRYLHVVMQKREDRPFSPPIEVHAGLGREARGRYGG